MILVKKIFILNILLAGIFLLLMFVIQLLPQNAIKNSVIESVSILENEGLYPGTFQNKYSSNSFLSRDQYTDCLMLNIAASTYEDQKNLKTAILNPCLKSHGSLEEMPQNLKNTAAGIVAPNVNYDWYWHGYLVVLKPLLLFWNYAQIRWINCLLMFVVVGWTLILIAKHIGKWLAVLFLSMLCMMHFETVPFTMQYASIFFVTFVSIIVLLSFPKFFLKAKNDYLAFYCIGAISVFVDFLTAPTVSLGLPMIVWMLYKPDDQKMKTVIYLSLLWGLGYASLWASKWIICYFTYDPSVMANALLHADKWSGAQEEHSRLFMTIGLAKRYFALFWTFNWIWGMFVAAVAMCLLPVKKQWKKDNAWLLLIALIPFAWSLVLVNHNYVHFGFVWRLISVTLLALLVWVYKSIAWNKIYK